MGIEKYFGLLSEDTSLSSMMPIFKDISEFMRDNSSCSIEDFVKYLTKESGLDEDDMRMKKNIDEYISSTKARPEYLLVVKLVDLSPIDITHIEKDRNIQYLYRDIPCDNGTAKFIQDISETHALPLFQDAKYMDPKTGEECAYKGLYVVFSKVPQGG